MVMKGTPEGNDRGTRVEVEKARGGEATPEKVAHQAAAG